jgi:hypothetical protein
MSVDLPKKRNMWLVVFDVDPTKIKMTYNIPVYPISEMPEFVKENKIKIAILAVPAISRTGGLLQTGFYWNKGNNEFFSGNSSSPG